MHSKSDCDHNASRTEYSKSRTLLCTHAHAGTAVPACITEMCKHEKKRNLLTDITT